MTIEVEAGIEYSSRAGNMNNTEAWKIWEGRTVDGKFPLLRWVGRSDHSAVFLTDVGGPQKAVIKLIAASLNADRQLSRWAAAAKLSHPHLIHLIEMGRCRFDGTPLLFLVMEYAEEDLSQIIPQRALTPAEVGDMLPPVLDALSYLHSRGLVHSRVRPSNILAVGDHLKLSTDRVYPRGESDEKLAAPSIYDAPELAAGEIYPAIDVWSLGVTLVEVLTQNCPANNTNEQKDPVVPEGVSEPFRSIAREALHRQVKHRCTVSDIKAWRPPQQPAPPPPGTEMPVSEKPARGPWRWLVLIALLFITVGIVGLIRHIFPAKTSDKAPVTTVTSPAENAPASSPQTETQPAASTQGAVVRQVIPDVPQSAKNTITGRIKVAVRVEVDASGKVTNATLTKPGPSKYFARLALAAAQKCEFAAPQANAQPTPSTWTLRFEFSKASTKAFASREGAR